MQLITIELTNEDSLKALKELEEKEMIRILNETDLNSYLMPGEPLSENDFKKWIQEAEKSPTVSLNDAKQQWTNQKKNLRKNIR